MVSKPRFSPLFHYFGQKPLDGCVIKMIVYIVNWSTPTKTVFSKKRNKSATLPSLKYNLYFNDANCMQSLRSLGQFLFLNYFYNHF